MLDSKEFVAVVVHVYCKYGEKGLDGIVYMRGRIDYGNMSSHSNNSFRAEPSYTLEGLFLALSRFLKALY